MDSCAVMPLRITLAEGLGPSKRERGKDSFFSQRFYYMGSQPFCLVRPQSLKDMTGKGTPPASLDIQKPFCLS